MRLSGFVRIEVSGQNPTRFLNLCSQHHIAFWQIHPLPESTLRLSVAGRDAPRALALAQAANVDAHVTATHGLPFFLARFRRRTALILGLLLCFALLFVSSRYVWELQVSGDASLSPAQKEAILAALADCGVGVGTKARDVDIISIRNQMMQKCPELVWMTVNVTGSYADVIVKTRKVIPKVETEPTNVIAAKSGLILRIDTLEGAAMVSVGQVVQEGRLLVSGIVNSKSGLRLTHARARVSARTSYNFTAILPKTAQGKRFTGRTVTRQTLTAGQTALPLYVGKKQPFDACEAHRLSRRLALPFGLALPFLLTTEQLDEVELTDVTVSATLAKSLAEEELHQKLLRELDDRAVILSENVTLTEEPDRWVVALHADCEEQIAETIPIPLGN